MPMRYVLSAVQFGYARKAPAAVAVPPADAKADVDVTLVSVDEAAGTVTLAVPPQDPATHSTLLEVRAYLVPPDQVAALLDAQALMQPTSGAAHPFGLADASAMSAAGGNLTVKLPDGPDGDFAGRVVLGFDA